MNVQVLSLLFTQAAFYVRCDYCNTLLPAESVCGIQVLNEGNSIVF